MRTWVRLQHRERCGNCGAELSQYSLAQRIELHGLKRKLFRCQLCADSQPEEQLLPPPPVLEDLGERLAKLRSIMPTRTRGALKQMAQIGRW